MTWSRAEAIRCASFILTGLALFGILALHLLVPLLSGLLIYVLVLAFTPFAQRVLPSRRGKLFVVAMFSALVIAAVVGAVLGLVSFFHHDVQNLPNLIRKVEEILDHVRSEIPEFLAKYLPDDIADLQRAAVDWLRAHVAELQMIGAHTLVTFAETIIALVIGAIVSLREVAPHTHAGPLAVALTERASRFALAFQRVALSQLTISLLNTIFTAIYLAAILPMFGVHLPLTKTMIAITFVVGLLPAVGNLISNTIVVIVSLDHSLPTAIASLAFLVGIHKLEYVLGARITGSRIQAQIWELLLAMMTLEAMFGVPGLVAAPIYYAYLKGELLEAKLI